MQHTKVQIGDKSLLPEIEKRVMLPAIDGQVGQVLAKGPDGTTVWTEGGGLPSGAKDGDLLIKSAEIVGNDYNDGHTVLFIQGSASNAAAADTPLPVTWNNQPAVQEDNTLLLTGSTQLSTASAPEVKRVFGGEFTVEAYLKPTQFNNTSRQDTNFFYLNGPSTYYIYLSNYDNSGNAQNGKFGLWAYSGNRQITLNNNEFHHVALDVYMDGTTRKYTIYYDGVAVQTADWYNDGVADSTNAIIRFFSSSDGASLNNCYLKSIRVSDIARYKGKSFTPPANGLYLPAPDGEWVTINRSNFVEQNDSKLNPEPSTVDETKYGFSPALKKDTGSETFAYEMPSKANDVPVDSTLQLNDSGTPVFVEAEKVLLSDAKSTKLNQLDVTRQLPANPDDNVTAVYKKQDVIGSMYNDSKVVVLLQGSKTNTAKNAAFQLTGGDEVTVDSDGNLVFNRGNGIIVPADKFNNEANGQFTVDIMIAVDELPTSNSYEYIFGNDNSPTYPFNYRVHSDGTVRFQYQNTNHNIQIEQGIFALLSFDYDGTTLRSYKDGVLVGAQDITYSAFPNTIGIGTDQYYQHTGFAGRIKYIRMSNIARYRGQAFTPPGLAGYITPPDGEWTTAPAIGDDRLLPENPSDGDLAVYGIVPEAAAPSGLISFTSDPNWVVSHSGSYSGRDGWQAFDDDRSSAWCTYEAKIGDWLQWEYKGEAGKVLLRRYQIAKAWGNGDCPTSWKIQGSNDGVKWVDLDERSGQSFPNNDYNEYTIPGNKTPYKFHRFYLLDWNTSNMIGDFKAWSWIDSVDECEGWFLLNQSSLGVDLSNYTGGTISLNATEALNLSSAKSMVISTGEMNQSLSLSARTVYIGTPDPNVVSEGDTDVQATEPFSIYLEGHAQNSPGGFAVVASNGKLPSSILPDSSIDLSNYSNDTISLTASNVFHIRGNILNVGTVGTSEIQIGNNSSSVYINASAEDLVYLRIGGTSAYLNAPGGLARVGLNGKLPASIIPETSAAIAAPKRAYIPIPKGDNGATITEMFVELKFTDTKNFESGAVDVNMTNAAAAMFGVTSVAKDNGSVVPSLVQMTEAGVPIEFFETYLLLDIDYLGDAGLQLLDDDKTYIAAYRWRATLEDDTTNTPWRLLSY